MKKTICVLLVLTMVLVLGVPVAAQTYETEVTAVGTGIEEYVLVVPESLTAGGAAGVVSLTGTWPSNKTICVDVPDTLTLTNSITGADEKTTNIVFDGIAQAGSNTDSIAVTENISVGGIENALFGTWSGSFTYTVTVKEYDLANTTWTLNETVSGYESVFGEFMESDWIDFPANSTVTVTYTDQTGGEAVDEILGLSRFYVAEAGVATLSSVYDGEFGVMYVPENNLGFPAGWYAGDSREFLNGNVTDINVVFNTMYRPCTAPVITFTDEDSEVLNNTAIIDWLYANATKHTNP